MKNIEKSFEFGSIKPSKEEKLSMRQSFELQMLTAALLGGKISSDRFDELVKKRVGINSTRT